MKNRILGRFDDSIIYEYSTRATFDGVEEALIHAVKRALKEKAHLIKADLKQLYLDDTNVHGTSFAFSDLRGTMFTDCTMSDADFQHADLRSVEFIHSHLHRVNFLNANLAGVNFEGCCLNDCVGLIQGGEPHNFPAYGWVYEDRLMINIGCRTMRADDFKMYYYAKPNRVECLAAVKYIVEVATLRGWKI